MTDIRPWTEWRTNRPQPFLIDLEGTSLKVGVGDPDAMGIAHMGNLTDRNVYQLSGGGDLQIIRSYFLRLPRWSRADKPELFLHPLALAHLFVTEQVIVGDVMSFLASAGPRLISRQVSQEITRQCDLLARLRAPAMRLTLCTAFDVTVRAVR